MIKTSSALDLSPDLVLITVAIVEDHALIRQGFEAIINATSGMEVHSKSENGQAFLDHLAKSKSLPSVSLLDISMPILGGHDTLLELKKKWPEANVLIVTMSGHPQSYLRVMDAGADGYLLKEDSAEDLIEAIKTIASGKIYYNNRMLKMLRNCNISPKQKATKLTTVEKQILHLSATELTYGQIADRLGITNKSLEGHRAVLFQKLDVASRTGLALFALQTGHAMLD